MSGVLSTAYHEWRRPDDFVTQGVKQSKLKENVYVDVTMVASMMRHICARSETNFRDKVTRRTDKEGNEVNEKRKRKVGASQGARKIAIINLAMK